MPHHTGICGRQLRYEFAAAEQQSSPHDWHFQRHTTQTRDIYVDFEIPYVYDFNTKLCCQKAKVIRNGKMKIFATFDNAMLNIQRHVNSTGG